MKTSALFWVGFGALAMAVGCATTTIDSTGDQTSGTDPGASTDDGGGQGDEGGSSGGGGLGGGGGGGGSSDAGKSPGPTGSGKDAGSTAAKDSGAPSSAGAVPTTCTQADGQIGCCDPSGVLYYCTAASKLTMQACTGGNVCGWSTKGYYDCVPSPAGADPSGTSPMTCGGGSSGGMDAGTTTTDAGSTAPTWTTIYNTIFGPSGTSTCAGSGCHTSSKSGFACGSSKTTCYNGFVNAGYITPGANASTSALVDPNQSPLCGTLGGNMPIGNSCVTAAQIKTIKSWLAAGAANN